jgi:hypothetical protein
MLPKVILIVLASLLIGDSEGGVAVAHASHIHAKEGSHKERVADGAYSPRDAHHHVSLAQQIVMIRWQSLANLNFAFFLEWGTTRRVL